MKTTFRYSEIPKEWEPPAPQPFKVQSDLQWYLMDPDAYDQFLVGIGTGVALQVWQNALPEPVLLQERPVRFKGNSLLSFTIMKLVNC